MVSIHGSPIEYKHSHCMIERWKTVISLEDVIRKILCTCFPFQLLATFGRFKENSISFALFNNVFSFRKEKTRSAGIYFFLIFFTFSLSFFLLIFFFPLSLFLFFPPFSFSFFFFTHFLFLFLFLIHSLISIGEFHKKIINITIISTATRKHL